MTFVMIICAVEMRGFISMVLRNLSESAHICMESAYSDIYHDYTRSGNKGVYKYDVA